MATARIRNEEWQQDDDLKDMLARYVKENLRRREILDFVCRDFDQYAWSLRSLDRRLEYFNIRYTDRNVELGEIETAVRQEMDGPGKLLGYRALHKKLRQVHELNVPRDVVYAVMYNVDPVALEERAPQFKKKKPKSNFTSRGSNWVHSLDGHDKLMGYQNSTFPIAVYGCMDTSHDIVSNIPKCFMQALLMLLMEISSKSSKDTNSRAPTREYFCAFPETSALRRCTTKVSSSLAALLESLLALFPWRSSFILSLNLLQV